MTKIYTKTGDEGTTSLANGERVGKDDPRIELLGEMDELNAMIGVIKAMKAEEEPWNSLQEQLMALMGYISKKTQELNREETDFFMQCIQRMEKTIDSKYADNKFHFIKPGADTATAFTHLARAKARTCERRMVALAKEAPIPNTFLIFINRLSDYLFVLALH